MNNDFIRTWYSSLTNDDPDKWNTAATVTLSPGSLSSVEYDTPYLHIDTNTTESANQSKKKNGMRFENGKMFSNDAYIMPDIKNIKIINQKDEFDGSLDGKVLIVEFADGTSEKAVTGKYDTFNFEQGISICITKKLLSMKTRGSNQSSTAIYNKIINHAIRVFNKVQEDNYAEYVKKCAEEKRQRKIAEKKAKRKAKREAAQREREIEIQKEAYVRAMKELNQNG